MEATGEGTTPPVAGDLPPPPAVCSLQVQRPGAEHKCPLVQPAASIPQVISLGPGPWSPSPGSSSELASCRGARKGARLEEECARPATPRSGPSRSGSAPAAVSAEPRKLRAASREQGQRCGRAQASSRTSALRPHLSHCPAARATGQRVSACTRLSPRPRGPLLGSMRARKREGRWGSRSAPSPPSALPHHLPGVWGGRP